MTTLTPEEVSRMTTPIAPIIRVPAQDQLIFVMRDFPLPEVTPRGSGFVAHTERNGEWVEFYASNAIDAVESLVALMKQRPSSRAN